jgi:hypothetical protein
MICVNCGNELTGQRKLYCTDVCKLVYYRRTMKQRCVEYKGGECQRCGYSTCLKALTFHHLDSELKEFGISAKGNTRSWEKIKAELDKCILLCHNCHAEHHAGLW